MEDLLYRINTLDMMVKETFSLNIHLSTVGHILKQNNNTFEEMHTIKRSRAVTYPEFDDALHEWVLQNQAYLILSDAILTEKAKAFANLLNIPEGQLKFSSDWLSRFKKRHGIAKIKLHREDASVDLKAFDQRMEGCKVILLLDGSKTHSTADQYEDESSENNQNMLSATQFIVSAWNDVTTRTIFNCFCHTKILLVTAETNTYDDNVDNDTDNELINELYIDIKALHFRNEMDIDSYIDYSEENISVNENEFEYNLIEADMFEDTETEDFESDVSENND
ncbi:16627_t:CDS:2 [Cetraspora pellucida]|uniref:16627_t:CDS:1 n=1 Tax=Cetraspora pellucida TaxID=1433469 RepID=A0A9N9G527_9GLOM|nr:16627_t:CDS:2 [Cetraspora pellucida]